ncbi:hypothetical protein Tco_0696182 [Tanacetum coccineum]
MTNMNIDLEISLNTGEYLEKFVDEKMELILEKVYDKLDDEWFGETIIDGEDLDGIVDYLELKSYDGVIDVDDKSYKKKMCKLLGITYEMPTLMLVPSCFAILTLSLCHCLYRLFHLVSLTNILILCLILKASNQSLRKSLSLNLELS